MPISPNWTGKRGRPCALVPQFLDLDEDARPLSGGSVRLTRMCQMMGIGRLLFKALAAEAERRGCQRLDWAVLDWNEPAMEFYRRMGAGG